MYVYYVCNTYFILKKGLLYSLQMILFSPGKKLVAPMYVLVTCRQLVIASEALRQIFSLQGCSVMYSQFLSSSQLLSTNLSGHLTLPF